MRLFILIILVCFAQPISAQTFVIDKSDISFVIKNFGTSVKGVFKEYVGVIEFDVNNPSEIKFSATIVSRSIDTGISMRDNHLKKKDYFNVAEFPSIQFTSSKVSLTKAGEGIVTGQLTIKDVSKSISFPFRYTFINGTPQFTGTVSINRRDFKIGGYSISMSDEVEISLQIKTQKQN